MSKKNKQYCIECGSKLIEIISFDGFDEYTGKTKKHITLKCPLIKIVKSTEITPFSLTTFEGTYCGHTISQKL